MPTIAEIVSLYPIAQYKAAIDIPSRGLYGGGVNIELPQKIRNIGNTVKRIYDADPNDSTLPLTANFLWTLLGIYGLQALVTEQSAGTIASVVAPPAGLPLPIDWRVSGTASATAVLATGESSVTLDGTGGMPDLRGYNIAFTRGGLPQYTTDPGDGSTYYSWNRTTGYFQLFNGVAALDEAMRIDPIS